MLQPIWEGKIDGRYEVKVLPDDDFSEYGATLQIWDGPILKAQEPVRLAYAARFGPDAEDVRSFQEISVTIVDSWKNEI